MDWTLEVVILPVSDIDRSIAFYRDQVGFDLDHDTTKEHLHVAQLTPPGSGCSIVFGDLPSQREMEPGSMRGLQLVVADAKAARRELLDRGVDASEIMEFSPDDGGTFFGFSDPDGNTWAVQQLKVRSAKPAHPAGASRPLRRLTAGMSGRSSGAGSLRWMLLHMLEETARHAGHLDTIRELLDGEKGYY